MKKDDDIICETNFVNAEKVMSVRKSIPDDDLIDQLSITFKDLSDLTRLKILLSLSIEELCVCDISALVGVSVSAISHQLRLLKDAKLVKYRKLGKMVYYSLDDDHVNTIVGEAVKHCVEYVHE